MPTKYSRSELIEELQSLAEELDRPPTVQDLQEHGSYSVGPYRRVFGSWNQAITTAGLEPNDPPVSYSQLGSEGVTRDDYRASPPDGPVRATELTYRINGRAVTLALPARVEGPRLVRITEAVFMVDSRGDECWLLQFEAKPTDGDTMEWWMPFETIAEKLDRGDMVVNNAEIH